VFVDKQIWVKTWTAAREAKKLIPHAIFVEPDFGRYWTISNKLIEYLREFTNWVEVFSIDEMRCDITWMAASFWLDEERFAFYLKHKIKRSIWIPVSIGVARTKLLAKLFSDINKPFWHFIWTDDFVVDEVLKTHDVDEVCFIGDARAARLAIPDALTFKQMDHRLVKNKLGMDWLKVWMELNWRDIMTFETKKPKNIVRTRSFHPHFTSDKDIVRNHVVNNLQKAYTEMRKHDLATNRVWISFRDKNYRRYWKDVFLQYATTSLKDITEVVKKLFSECFYQWIMYRTTWVYFWWLSDPRRITLDLFSAPSYYKDKAISDAVSKINQKFWKTVIKSANQKFEYKQKSSIESFISFTV
jgi:nucleotidyltransferase/DNA polymerase involved in DNA repair